MSLFEFDIGEKARVSAEFISHVRKEVQRAIAEEKKCRKLTQQGIATRLGVNRSVVNRQVTGIENLTLRSVAEILWAIGWEPHFEARKAPDAVGENQPRLTVSSHVEPLISRSETQTARGTAHVTKLELDPV